MLFSCATAGKRSSSRPLYVYKNNIVTISKCVVFYIQPVDIFVSFLMRLVITNKRVVIFILGYVVSLVITKSTHTCLFICSLFTLFSTHLKCKAHPIFDTHKPFSNSLQLQNEIKQTIPIFDNVEKVISSAESLIY